MIYLYNLVILILLPIYIFFLWKEQRGFLRLKERLGFLPKSNNNPIWIHSVSLGESKISLNLAEILKERGFNPFLTSTTKAGLLQLQKSKFPFSAFPIDFYPFQLQAIKRIKPKAIVMIETEIWPSIIEICNKKKIPFFIVNARVSDNHFKRYIKFKGFFTDLLGDIFLSSLSEESKKRFLELGVREENCTVLPNMKFDIEPPEEKELKEFRAKTAHLFSDTKMITIIGGSIREGEEEIIINTFKKMKETHSNIRLIFAPRHSDRVKTAKDLCEKNGLKFALRSKGESSQWDVLIIDTLGELFYFYSYADIAIIGGTFKPFGGQNPLEPALFKVPILTGKHFNNFYVEMMSLIKNHAAILCEEEKLFEALKQLLENDSIRRDMAEMAFTTVQLSKGSTVKTANFLEQNLKKVVN